MKQKDTIYLGIDVHKKTYSLTAISEGCIIKRDTIVACPDKLIHYCKKHFPAKTIKSAYEAGFCGFYLHRKLIGQGINNFVVHPASIEISARDRVKTDKRDSLKIATQLEAGRLKCIHIPSPQQEAFRAISRLREKLMKDRNRIGVQVKSFINLNGLSDYQDERRISRKFMLNLLSLEDISELIFYLHTMAKRWIEIDQEIIGVNQRLADQAKSQANLERIYQSAPGIGPIASRHLINELGDMSQFKNEKAIFSFTGFTPQEYSSGEHIRQGHISRQGRPILRKILVQAAWVAIKKDEGLKLIYEKISAKAGKKRAIVAVARRMIGHIRACLQKNEEYSYKRVANN